MPKIKSNIETARRAQRLANQVASFSTSGPRKEKRSRAPSTTRCLFDMVVVSGVGAGLDMAAIGLGSEASLNLLVQSKLEHCMVA